MSIKCPDCGCIVAALPDGKGCMSLGTPAPPAEPVTPKGEYECGHEWRWTPEVGRYVCTVEGCLGGSKPPADPKDADAGEPMGDAVLIDQYRKALTRFGVTFADNGLIRMIPRSAALAAAEQGRERFRELVALFASRECEHEPECSNLARKFWCATCQSREALKEKPDAE